MNLTPRSSEYAPIVAMLESDDYQDATSLAKAVVVHAMNALLKREWWLTVVKTGETADGRPLQLAYGLSPTETQAARLDIGEGPRMVLPVTSARGHEARVVKLETVPTKTFEPPVRRVRATKKKG